VGAGQAAASQLPHTLPDYLPVRFALPPACVRGRPRPASCRTIIVKNLAYGAPGESEQKLKSKIARVFKVRVVLLLLLKLSAKLIL
jgi:hypothetical protein